MKHLTPSSWMLGIRYRSRLVAELRVLHSAGRDKAALCMTTLLPLGTTLAPSVTVTRASAARRIWSHTGTCPPTLQTVQYHRRCHPHHRLHSLPGRKPRPVDALPPRAGPAAGERAARLVASPMPLFTVYTYNTYTEAHAMCRHGLVWGVWGSAISSDSGIQDWRLVVPALAQSEERHATATRVSTS